MEQSELDWDAWEMFSLDEDGAEINADSMTESQTDTDSTELDDFDPWELFYSNENDSSSGLDDATEGQPVGKESYYADLLEKSFLSGLQGDTESDIILDEETIETADADAKPSAEQDIQNEFTVRFPEERGIMRLEQQLQEAFDQAVQERLAKEGAELLDKGGMPSEEQLQAMGIDKPRARGFQSLVWLSTEGDPVARSKVEAMIDQTAKEAQLEQQQESTTEKLPVGMQIYAPERTDSANHPTDIQMVDLNDLANSGLMEGNLKQRLENHAATFEIKDGPTIQD